MLARSCNYSASSSTMHKIMKMQVINFTSTIRMGTKCDFSYSDCGMIFGAIWAALNTADLLGFTHTSVYSE